MVRPIVLFLEYCIIPGIVLLLARVVLKELNSTTGTGRGQHRIQYQYRYVQYYGSMEYSEYTTIVSCFARVILSIWCMANSAAVTTLYFQYSSNLNCDVLTGYTSSTSDHIVNDPNKNASNRHAAASSPQPSADGVQRGHHGE